MNRVTMTSQEIKDLSDQMREAGTYFMAGNNSLFIPSTQTKVMDVSAVRQWPTIDGELVPMTPGEAARTELSRQFPGIRRVGWLPGHVKLFSLRPPLYCNPVGPGKYVQLDLTSAYHQIYKYLWLDTPYPLGYGNKSLWEVGERLAKWKQARNAIIGVCRSRNGVAFKDGRRIQVSTQNSWLSPGLWATVQSILHEIATRAIEFGAVYVNTDGYIFPVQSPGWDLFENWLEKWNFDWSVRHEGRGEIAGWSCYKVGKSETYLYRIGSRPYGKINTVSKSSEDRFTAYLERCRWRSYRHERYVGDTHQTSDDNHISRNDGANIDDSGRDAPVQPRLFEHE